jgi:hypothetical protein
MPGVIGYLIYLNMGDGCLTSKYGNTESKGLFTEAAVRIQDLELDSLANKSKDKFVGKYVVTWIEGTTGADTETAHLIIRPNPDSEFKYNLFWNDVGIGNKALYYGQGMLYGDILVAAYWSPDAHKPLDPPGPKF